MKTKYEHLFSKEKLMLIAEELERGHFKPGYDNMTAQAALIWIDVNYDNLLSQLKESKYKPSPLLGFSVTKKNGQFRQLTKASAVDMIVMKVMTQYLDELTKPLYSCHIHAYLSERGVTTALREFCEYAAGYRYVLKIDPTDFFGSIDRRILAASMSGIGLSKKLIKQTMLFITAPVIEDGKISKKETGIPQGLPIAPVLSNLYLHSFDLFLEQHHCVYIRYADDVVVFGDDYDELTLLYQEVVSFLSERLALSINHTKCGIDIPERITYLGYRFERNSNGIITTGTDVPKPVVNRSWSTSKPKGKNSHINIISDGILSKHDFALRFHPITLSTIYRYTVPKASMYFPTLYLTAGFCLMLQKTVLPSICSAKRDTSSVALSRTQGCFLLLLRRNSWSIIKIKTSVYILLPVLCSVRSTISG